MRVNVLLNNCKQNITYLSLLVGTTVYVIVGDKHTVNHIIFAASKFGDFKTDKLALYNFCGSQCNVI